MVVPNEIALMHRLSPCPHIIQLIEWFEKPDSYVIVMERPDSCLDLFDYITEQKSLSEDTARTFFWQVRKIVILSSLHCEVTFRMTNLWFVAVSGVLCRQIKI